MKRSDQVNELAAALAKAQAKIKDAEKDKENPAFRSGYATLASVWQAVRAPLTDNGLSVVQSPSTTEEGNVMITTLLLHSSGQWIEDELVLTPVKKDPQGFGSAITYGRRYSLMSIAGNAPGDESDDDANAASAPPPRARQQPSGAPSPVQPKASAPTDARTKSLQGVLNPVNWPTGTVAEYCARAFGTAKLSELNDTQFAELMGAVRSKTAMQAKAELQPMDFDQTTAAPPLAEPKARG